MTIPRDENRRTAGAALTDDVNLDIRNLLVDPVTGRLLIDMALVSSTVPYNLNVEGRDDNWVPNNLASNGTSAKSLLIDNRNGLLSIDVFVE